MPREAILIPMRLGSSRLPRKGLQQVGPYSALGLLVGRLRHARRPGVIMLCTTTEPSDDALVAAAERLAVPVYRGDRDDVLRRLTEAAEACDAERIAEVDGDDLFCDPGYLDLALERLDALRADYFAFEALPFGLNANAVRRSALRRACEEKAAADTSTGIFNFILKSGRFRVVVEPAARAHAHAGMRATLDYPEDLAFFRAVVGRFPGRELDFTIDELLALVEREPALLALNAGRSEDYWAHFRAHESSSAGRTDTHDGGISP